MLPCSSWFTEAYSPGVCRHKSKSPSCVCHLSELGCSPDLPWLLVGDNPWVPQHCSWPHSWAGLSIRNQFLLQQKTMQSTGILHPSLLKHNWLMMKEGNWLKGKPLWRLQNFQESQRIAGIQVRWLGEMPQTSPPSRCPEDTITSITTPRCCSPQPQTLDTLTRTAAITAALRPHTLPWLDCCHWRRSSVPRTPRNEPLNPGVKSMQMPRSSAYALASGWLGEWGSTKYFQLPWQEMDSSPPSLIWWLCPKLERGPLLTASVLCLWWMKSGLNASINTG